MKKVVGFVLLVTLILSCTPNMPLIMAEDNYDVIENLRWELNWDFEFILEWDLTADFPGDAMIVWHLFTLPENKELKYGNTWGRYCKNIKAINSFSSWTDPSEAPITENSSYYVVIDVLMIEGDNSARE